MLTADPFSISNEQEFNDLALSIFRHQREHCVPYARFLETINRPEPSNYKEIPFLPVSAFKLHKVYTSPKEHDLLFESSGTTGMVPSRHFVADKRLYEKSFLLHFEQVLGTITDWCILALLPSYLERKGSSLVYMAEHLIKKSGHPMSGFYLHDHTALHKQLIQLKEQEQKTLLIGVSFALLDFVEGSHIHFPELKVMETGGMKGRKKELLRDELHARLCEGFHVDGILSEYGMTELLSQAYSIKEGRFHSPPWMKVLIRELNDPFHILSKGYSGGVNVIDLANIHSCSFIATDDLGRHHNDGSFEILGRFDHSDMRGCSLLV